MNAYETANIAVAQANLAIAERAADASVGSVVIGALALCTSVAVVILMRWGIKTMKDSNENRAETERHRHEQIMTAFKDAAEDRKLVREQAEQQAKVTNGLLAALERQGQALERLINRTDAVVVELQRHQGPGTRPRRRA